MLQRSTQRSPGFFGALYTLLDRGRLRPASSPVPERRAPFQPRLEALEDRTLLAVQLLSHYNGLDFLGSHTDFFLNFAPDTVGAAGPTSYVETVNSTVAIYMPKATADSAISDDLFHFFFVTGGLPHASPDSALGDATIVWDDQVQRFIVADLETDVAGHDAFPMAVSKSASPATLTTADWNFYTFVTSEAGLATDYPGNLGYNHDAFVWTFNMFRGANFDHVEINSVSIADLVAGVPSPAYVKTQMLRSGDSWRPTVMHDSVAGDPMWFIQDGFTNTTLRVIKETDLLTSPSFSVTTLTVASHFPVVPPMQPDGTTITTNVAGTRIFKAAEYKNNIVATHHVSPNSARTEDDARWYRIDVSSGTPTLADQGNVSAGNNTYITYPGIDINADGLIGLSYMESGLSGPYLSVYVTGRLPGDPPGTMETPVLVQAGERNYHDNTPPGRAGDFSGINVDTDGTFWIANEFANTELIANWGTTIGHFSIVEPPVPPPAKPRALEGIDQQFGLGSFVDTNSGSISPWTVAVNGGGATPKAVFVTSTQDPLGSQRRTYAPVREGTVMVTVMLPIARGAQEQIATFFAADGQHIIHPEPACFFEVPIHGPLPEDLNYIP